MYKNRIFTPMLILIAMVLTSGCTVHHRNVEELERVPSFTSQDQVFYKVIEAPSFGTGATEIIAEHLKTHPFFKDATEVAWDDIPETGTYIEVNPEYIEPSIYALLFGYVSLGTLTFVPAWSNDDGYDVVFSVHQLGQPSKEFSYSTRRFVAIWAGLLPFAWVNAFTNHESDALAAVTDQFLVDLNEHLATDQ